MADEFATCPRTFEAAALAAEPNRFYCLPTEGCCIDEDDDNYGEGVFCDGADCNDNDELVYPGADELCNGDDDNCDNLADNAPIDCAQQGCSFNGTNYVQTPTAACANGMCEQVTTNTCGLYSCVGGMADGDVCAGECVFENVENDNFCIPSAHCEAQGCVLDRPDGGVCTADSDCANDHCDSGICCSGVECCNDNMDCPGFPGAGLLCTDTPMCQGTIGSVTCNLTSFECESLNGAPDDAGCTSSVEANDCGPYPTVFCAGTSNQSAPTCATSCNVDGECDPNAHCDNNLCVLDLPDGNACDEGSDCGSSHCQNNFCCSGGDCCAMASQCPAIYSSASVCIDDATCQGTRSDAICTGNVCGTQAAIQDDSGCGTMTEADTCASFPSVFCNGMSTQSRPSCQAACTLDSQCDSGSHCDGLCIPDITDGGVCDENSDCLTDHCQNGRCCAGGDCCATPANCPASYSANSTCGDTSTCQGTRSDATCTASICGTQAGVPDDSGCNVSSVSSNCGAYPSATCAGTADQSAPVCSSSCSTDSNCDANAHCDNGVCILDVPNGDVCDEDSDCTAGHCQNGYCCASGDCCSAATNCPASYRSAAACTSNSTCQGSRTDATCTSNQCGTTAPINDDRGCTAGLMALSCGAFPDRFCDGQETQTPPVCAAACTLDSQCMANAHCDAVCVPDQGNGTSCDEDSDCAGAHCQNGFCCASGDCCAVAANCPGSYGAASTCNTAATCQGTRSDAACNASFQCATQTGVPDDTGCGVLAIANTCGFFPSVTCNASADQVPPMCTTGCVSDAGLRRQRALRRRILPSGPDGRQLVRRGLGLHRQPLPERSLLLGRRLLRHGQQLPGELLLALHLRRPGHLPGHPLGRGLLRQRVWDHHGRGRRHRVQRRRRGQRLRPLPQPLLQRPRLSGVAGMRRQLLHQRPVRRGRALQRRALRARLAQRRQLRADGRGGLPERPLQQRLLLHQRHLLLHGHRLPRHLCGGSGVQQRHHVPGHPQRPYVRVQLLWHPGQRPRRQRV
ncbi:MAG: putative metal-binding motif-containing protein [Sandaracinaceae bacterium]|nr:putative metal-binding motif-containing protein [Sandaracinaceae bacterium]